MPAIDERPSLLGITSREMKERLLGLGVAAAAPMLAETAYRGVHRTLAASFADLDAVGRRKQEILDGLFRLEPLEMVEVQRSWDQSARYAFRLHDGPVIETVLIPHHGKWTACVSSQAGCALACSFCATGMLGLSRNLRADEIVAQVHAVARHSGKRISDLVFMGMGEPLQNEAAVFQACLVLRDEHGFQISPRRMVISTAGVVPAILRYAATRHRMNLVFSLASAVPEKRARLMPIQARYGFASLLDAIRTYAESRRGRHVTLEYIAIRNLTLGDDDVEAIREHLSGFRFILNVIPLNPTGGEWEAPLHEEVRAFTDKLRPLGFPVKIRRSSGRDQVAGCGQLGTSVLRRLRAVEGTEAGQ